MTEERDNALEVAKLCGEFKVLEDRTETKQAEYRTDIARCAENVSKNAKESA
ncbi:MAG: hypothetical protein OXE94_01240 [Aestuariivita sp.]|nr:hypothetical protein [Aestuariivita sp.]MCY4201753.1 hypothetical protein [Aestuariivita sp.]MCY4289423.1 hypothetical protein [Aestuariivita sp.]MCY4346648.1 hypothetical protein [Aestuariivita sp.]